ncbi:MAG: hypothetical protein EAZ53_06255 [Bacteroidetes bacterium]|nr:MAG: hypothetical protein EAZ53_06255 [Bacteroidota bacterium]
MDTNEIILTKIIDFTNKIGIKTQFCDISKDEFLPGLKVEKGVLLIDKSKLLYVGDILHEAGHIALMTKEEKEMLDGNLDSQKDAAAIEMAAIAWSYAACLEIGIELSVVFHEDGYKGQSQQIIDNFANGYYFGVPILEWFGMCDNLRLTTNPNPIAFPKLRTWIRPEKTT